MSNLGTAPRFDAIFFDMDGTLVDSERISHQSGTMAFAEQGFMAVDTLLEQLVGIDQQASAQRIHAFCPGIDISRLRTVWNDAFEQMQADDLQLKPGAYDLVHGLEPHHPLALVTSSGRIPAQTRLVQAGLIQAFQAVITRDDVTSAKPAPEPYLLAATKLGVQPERCLVFEDSEPGAEAAWRAGMTVVQVPDLIPASGRFAHHIAKTLFEGAAWAGIWR